MPKKLLEIRHIVGRNGADPPLGLPDDQCVEALNVDWEEGGLGRRRPGCLDTLTHQAGSSSFTGKIYSLIRHNPSADRTADELWGVDNAATPVVQRKLTGGNGAWSGGGGGGVTLTDAIATSPHEVQGVSFNGKLFLFYDSTQNRLHVWDPNLGTPRVRRVGLEITAAPTVANQGAGAYAAVLRYYRTRVIQLNGTTVARRSEPSQSTSFTPSGAGASARVTLQTPPGEQETHWEVEASTDNVTFYRLAQVVIGTTTYDDSTATTAYSASPLSDIAGTYTLPTSAKYGITDGNRLLMAGAWETTSAKYSRVWFTPVLGSSDQGDDERIPNTSIQKNWIDINENDGGYITGFGGPLQGVVYVFKQSQIWKLIPTGDATAPYVARPVSRTIGCFSQKTILQAPDERGDPAIYFLDRSGPYRVGANGLQYLGRDVEDLWRGNSTITYNATNVNFLTGTIVAHGTYYPTLQQIFWWVATVSGGYNGIGAIHTAFTPDLRLVFHVRLGRPDQDGRIRGGWARHDSVGGAALCSALYYLNTVGVGDETPFFGYDNTARVYAVQLSGSSSDAGTGYQAYLTTKPLLVAPLGYNVGVGQTTILAKSTGSTSVTLTQTINRDFDSETVSATVALQASGVEKRRVVKVEGSDMSGAGALQLTLGDGASSTTAIWTIDAIAVPLTQQELR